MLRRMLCTVLTAVALVPWCATAQEAATSVSSEKGLNVGNKTDQLGVGVQIGTMSGVNLEYWMAADHTVNGSLTAERGNTAAGVAYNWLFHDSFPGDFNHFVPFVGAGALGAWGNKSDVFSRKTNENFALAAQVPVGVEYLPNLRRFSIFAEVSPSLEVVPTTHAFLSGDLGARYYF